MSQKFSRFASFAGAVTVVGVLAMAGVANATVPTLSQTSITLGSQQSMTITSENGTDVYMESNSGPTIVSVTINGTQIVLKGLAPGSATLSICGTGTASDCTNLYVTVQTTAVTAIAFSQNNLSLAVSGSQTVTLSGGNGTYSISSNSNTSVASTNLSGNSLEITGLETGGATITVCDTGGNCGTLSVNVGSSSSSSSGLTFSENNFSLAAGGNQVVTISGGNGTYNVANNSNNGVASTNLSGNQITINGVNAGSASVEVCDTSGICGTISLTVNSSTANGAVTFNPANPSLSIGESMNVALTGGASGYVVLSNQNSNIVQATMDGNDVTLQGESNGTDIVTVCATAGGCSPLTVTVGGTTSSTTTSTTPPTVTTTVTQTTGTTVANSALLSEIQTLQSAVTQALTQIQSIQSQLNQIEAQVSAGSGSGISTSASVSSGDSADFTELLTVGSQDVQVTELQDRLTTLGFYSGPVTGYYGSLTEQAVIRYQTAHGITATGSVGPDTRAALNAGD